MNCRLLLLSVAALLLASAGARPAVAQSTKGPAEGDTHRPNIVILVADDLGYGDVGFNGSDIQTPNLDRLAQQGVQLERFYATPVCSPTRAGLLTGRWPIRFGLQNAVIPPWRDRGLPAEEVTIAETLADAGYEHRACIGKWHLGHSHPACLPRQQGFTHFYGHLNGAIDYFTHERDGETDWHRNGEPVQEEGYSTDLLGAEAVRFIEAVPQDEPYLLYVPFNAPHSPFQAKEEDLATYPDRRGERRRAYAAMVDSMDQAIGRILEAIDRRGDAENTFVLFFSDNGGVNRVGDNGPFRGGKLSLFEGGLRVPAVVRWPAGGVSGGRVCDERMGYIDILPTVRRIAGLDAPPPRPLDGIDVLDALRDEATLPDRPWFNLLAQNENEPQQWSVQTDKWKLILRGHPEEGEQLAETGKVLLFHLSEDPREQQNVAAEHPEVVDGLKEHLATFREMAAVELMPMYGEGREGFAAPKNWRVGQ